jgi:SatD family (SatD)
MTKVALIGDLVDSRTAADRVAVHRRVLDALDVANTHTTALSPLTVTVGDEFQGVYATFGAAIKASHLTRLALAGASGVRFGLGSGSISLIDATRGMSDGTAWWAARDAIDAVEASARQPARSAVRTGLAAAPGQHVDPAVRAAVVSLDAALGKLSVAAHTILLTLVTDGRQGDVAPSLGITRQAVSQQVITHNLALIADAMTDLWEAR